MKRDDEKTSPRASTMSASASPRSSYAKPWDWIPPVLLRERAIAKDAIESARIRAVYPPIDSHSRSIAFVALFSSNGKSLLCQKEGQAKKETEREE